jgi:hypothetical protein
MFLQIGLVGAAGAGYIGYVIVIGVLFAVIDAVAGLLVTLFVSARQAIYAGLFLTIGGVAAVGLLSLADPRLRSDFDALWVWWALLLDTVPLALAGLGIGTALGILVRLLISMLRRSGAGFLEGAGRAALVYLGVLAGSTIIAAILTVTVL